MIICNSLEQITQEIKKKNQDVAIEKILAIDFPFLANEEKFTLLSIPTYESSKHTVVYISDTTAVLSLAKLESFENKFKQVLKKRHGQSTIITLLALKAVMKNYAHEFERIRSTMNLLDLDPVLETIEENGRDLRKLTDRMEGLLQIVIQLKEQDIDAFDTTLIPFEYELLNTEARYLLERCRSHVYRIASLRTKSEMQSNRELNDTMKKLTVIMTFLSIVAIVVNVPGTVGAIFGIPALSDAYFKAHIMLLVATLILTTIFSVLLGYWYWRSLGLKKP